MKQQTKEFTLRRQSKFGMLFLFLFVGSPMLYASYLNYNAGETLFAILMVALFVLWAVVLLIAIGFKIKLTDTSIHRQGLLSPSIIEFKDIEAIHFGSTWSNFYIESDKRKIYFGKDFENFDDILCSTVKKVRTVKNINQVKFMGDPDNIARYAGKNYID